MLARNPTLQSMKKAARLQVCTIVRSNAKKNISRRANQKRKISKITIKRRDLQTKKISKITIKRRDLQTNKARKLLYRGICFIMADLRCTYLYL